MKRYKYPKTYHLPWSPGTTDDDKKYTLEEVQDMFLGKEIVVTEKLDGENCTIYSDGVTHARSIDSRGHYTRDWVKALAGATAHLIPQGWRVCGENMYAKHSIFYDQLPTYFLVFNIFDDLNNCLSWDQVKHFAKQWNLETVPELYQGIWDIDKVKQCMQNSQYGEEMEGYVVRLAEAFPFDQFQQSVAKYVRKGHVQTSEHWLYSAITPNEVVK